jgi:SAM-dependent methyltransferase
MIPGVERAGAATHGEDYAERLIRLQTARWKRWFDVQALHRWSLRRLEPGFTLDLGCGIGRNLLHLRGQSVGVDVNEYCVRAARARGLVAFTPEEFRRSAEYCRPGRFDCILLAHVAEHMTADQVVALLRDYEPLLRENGRLLLISPQEAGFRSDATHVELMDFTRLAGIAERLGCRPERRYSFPFPRWAGRLFTYNEFVVVSRKPPASGGVAAGRGGGPRRDAAAPAPHGPSAPRA